MRLQVDEVSAHYLNISIIEDVNSWNTDVVIMAGGIRCFNNKFSSITKYRFSICLTAGMWCQDYVLDQWMGLQCRIWRASGLKSAEL